MKQKHNPFQSAKKKQQKTTSNFGIRLLDKPQYVVNFAISKNFIEKLLIHLSVINLTNSL